VLIAIHEGPRKNASLKAHEDRYKNASSINAHRIRLTAALAYL
jgi:hypothetical protein